MAVSGYSGTTLAKKLGFKDNHKVLLINEPDYYFGLFPALPKIELVNLNDTEIDVIHFFTMSSNEYIQALPKLMNLIKRNGMIWVSWPKKASKVETDIDENVIRDFGLKAGLVDVKVCSVNEIWSGLKFMYRLKDR